jgi:hypothetical protein
MRERESVIALLTPLAAQVETVAGYWFSSEFSDPGEDWCHDCAHKHADKLRAKHPDVRVDGGWTQEHDSQPFCKGCGARIDCTPTDEMVDSEIDHFAERCDGAIPPDVALDLLNIFENAESQPDRVEPLERIAAWIVETLSPTAKPGTEEQGK